MAPINNKNPNNMIKKQTGTVPKTNSTVANGSSSTSSHAIKASSAPKARSATSSSRKNTEIVAPTRRELNDLNVSINIFNSLLDLICISSYLELVLIINYYLNFCRTSI